MLTFSLAVKRKYRIGALEVDRFGQKVRQAWDDEVTWGVRMRSTRAERCWRWGRRGEGGREGGRSEGRRSVWQKCTENPLWRRLMGNAERRPRRIQIKIRRRTVCICESSTCRRNKHKRSDRKTKLRPATRSTVLYCHHSIIMSKRSM